MRPTERVGFLAWDDAGGMFLRVELTRGGEPSVATAAVLAWVGARPVYVFGLAVEPAGEATAGSVTVGGLRAAETGAGVWQLELDDGPNRLALRFEPFTAEVPFDLPAGLGAGHRESACRVSGAVELSGHAIAVDGVGQLRRARDAGTAPATGWRTATGYLGPSSRPVGGPATELAFSVWEVPSGEGSTVVWRGFVHAGGDHRIESVEHVEHDPMRLALTVDDGHRFTVRGHPHGLEVPVRPAGAGVDPDAVLRLQLVRWEADGLDGYGLVERLDHPGAPPTDD